MEEPYGEGLASHTGSKSCAWHLEVEHEMWSAARSRVVATLDKLVDDDLVSGLM